MGNYLETTYLQAPASPIVGSRHCAGRYERSYDRTPRRVSRGRLGHFFCFAGRLSGAPCDAGEQGEGHPPQREAAEAGQFAHAGTYRRRRYIHHTLVKGQLETRDAPQGEVRALCNMHADREWGSEYLRLCEVLESWER